MSTAKSPPTMEGKKPKWKLFSKSRTPSKEVLSHSAQKSPEPVPNAPSYETSQPSTHTSQTSSTLVQEPVDNRPKSIPLQVKDLEHHQVGSHVAATTSHNHSSPTTANRGSLNTVYTHHVGSNPALKSNPIYQPDVVQPDAATATIPQSILSSTSTPHFRQQTYTDPITGETTTTTITTVVTTTTVTKPPPPRSPPPPEMDVAEERRLAEELLAASEIDDSVAPPLRGLHPAPPVRRKSGMEKFSGSRKREETPSSSSTMTSEMHHSSSVAKKVSSSSGSQRILPLRDAPPPPPTVSRGINSGGGLSSHPVTRPECLLDENSDFGPRHEAVKIQVSSSSSFLFASLNYSPIIYADHPPPQPPKPLRTQIDRKIMPHADLIAPQPREQHNHEPAPPSMTELKDHGHNCPDGPRHLPDIQETRESPGPQQLQPQHAKMPIMAHLQSPQLVYPLTPPLDPQDPPSRVSWGEKCEEERQAHERPAGVRRRDSWGRTPRSTQRVDSRIMDGRLRG